MGYIRDNVYVATGAHIQKFGNHCPEIVTVSLTYEPGRLLCKGRVLCMECFSLASMTGEFPNVW